MGCCISTNTESPASKKHVGSDEASSKVNGFSHESRAPPPPPPVEEETVKEVLSETPKPKPNPIPPKPEPIFSPQMKQDLQQEEKKTETKINAHKVEAFAKIQENQNLGSNEEIMSEVSEFCSDSISENVSTMTNVTDKRDNEEEEEQRVRQRQRVVSRSPAKPPPRNGFKRDRVFSQSPSRRSDQSPGSIIGNGSSSVRLVQNQESGRVKGLIRRDPGESSGRRSRSPATTRSSAPMGRSPSAKRANRSPGRVGSGPLENNNGTSINYSSRKMEAKRAGDNSNDNCSTNESIENPLVSLECFIFL